jgi:hypothetical protein
VDLRGLLEKADLVQAAIQAVEQRKGHLGGEGSIEGGDAYGGYMCVAEGENCLYRIPISFSYGYYRQAG